MSFQCRICLCSEFVSTGNSATRLSGSAQSAFRKVRKCSTIDCAFSTLKADGWQTKRHSS